MAQKGVPGKTPRQTPSLVYMTPFSQGSQSGAPHVQFLKTATSYVLCRVMVMSGRTSSPVSVTPPTRNGSFPLPFLDFTSSGLFTSISGFLPSGQAQDGITPPCPLDSVMGMSLSWLNNVNISDTCPFWVTAFASHCVFHQVSVSVSVIGLRQMVGTLSACIPKRNGMQNRIP